MSTPILVIIADDHSVTAAGIAARLRGNRSFAIVALAESSGEVFSHLKEKAANVIFLSAEMPRCTETIKMILEEYPSVKVITMTFEITDAYLELLHQYAPHGSVMKDDSGEVLSEALKAVFEHGFYYTREVENKMLEHERKKSSRKVYIDLTRREKEILLLMEEGIARDEIARRLNIKVNTLDGHRKNIYLKLDVHKAQQATIKARKLGLLR